MGFLGFLGKVGKVIGKTIEVGKRVGGFIAKHHQTLAPLAHGLAVASGSQTAQKITGLGLAASQAATMGKPVLSAVGNAIHQQVSDKIAAMRAHHAAPPRPPPSHFLNS
jgi:hypothetical protein